MTYYLFFRYQTKALKVTLIFEVSSKNMSNIEEFVKVANQNEEYPVNVTPTTTDFQKVVTRKDFKSKHYDRAQTTCCAASIIIIILLICIWIFFEIKEADV